MSESEFAPKPESESAPELAEPAADPEVVEFVEPGDEGGGLVPPHKTRSAKHLRAMLSRAEPGSGSPDGATDDGLSHQTSRGRFKDAVQQVSDLKFFTSSTHLQNPMREHPEQYVVNMWKVYNHVYKAEHSRTQVMNLLFYVLHVMVMGVLLGLLPPPSVLLRHQTAVEDLLLGEEFDDNTTHIYKSWYDVMTAEEMWQWAEGPMAAAILVDGVEDGKVDALVGTNWLVGPVRIRQERSTREGDQCRFKLENTFGNRTGEALLARGIECTANWKERPAHAPPPPDFLNLSQPLESEGGASFREAFPEWYAEQTRGSGGVCCTVTAGCYLHKGADLYAEQQHAIARDRERGEWSLWKAGKQSREHACSINSDSGFLHHNPPHSYRSTIKDSPMVTENIWSKANEFGDGGFHIDLPGNSSTFKRQLTALQELNFVDQFTRAVTFQFLLYNGNTFTNQRGGHVGRLKEGLSEADRFEPSVVVDVDITFVFSPSGFLSKYDRVTAMQVEPLHFIFDGTRDMDKEREGVSMQWWLQWLMAFVPLFMLWNEFNAFVEEGSWRYFRKGWTLIEFVLIFMIFRFIESVFEYSCQETIFQSHWSPEFRTNPVYRLPYCPIYEPPAAAGNATAPHASPTELFNDILPLRRAYREMNKWLGFVTFMITIKVFKYVRMFRATTILWRTIGMAWRQLLTFMSTMGVIILAFGLCCTLIWGHNSDEFLNVPTSLMTLNRLAAGEAEMDYEELKRGDSGVTPALFMAILIAIAVVGMNMMIAIITDHYEEARDETKAWDDHTEWLREHFSGTDEYNDFYRGAGLWNEPAPPVVAGPVVEAFKTLSGGKNGHWPVQTVATEHGPRRWDQKKKTVEPLGQGPAFPIVLHRSSKVRLRYCMTSNEHSGNRGVAEVLEQREGPAGQRVEADTAASKPAGSFRGEKGRSHSFRNKSTPFSSVRAGQLVDPIDGALTEGPTELNLWMAASTLSQYKGIRYLEELQPGDHISLLTPSEGGLRGEVGLTFEKFEPTRRATRRDKILLSREIDQARSVYRQALVEPPMDSQSRPIPRCPHTFRSNCRRCVQYSEYNEKLEKLETDIQTLHEYRAELEGVDHHMIFSIDSAKAWQKFKPLSERCDMVDRQLGERLKARCLQDLHESARQLDDVLDRSESHMITKDAVLDVLVRAVTHGVEVATTSTYSRRASSPNAGQQKKIRDRIDQEMKSLADEEKAELEQRAAMREMEETRRVIARTPRAVRVRERPERLAKLYYEGECMLSHLVPKYHSTHPALSPTMLRLLKLAQRVQEVDEHAPLMEIGEHSSFELCFGGGNGGESFWLAVTFGLWVVVGMVVGAGLKFGPWVGLIVGFVVGVAAGRLGAAWDLQCRLIWRSMKSSFRFGDVLRWFIPPNPVRGVAYGGFWDLLPLLKSLIKLKQQYGHFHSEVEQDIESYLELKVLNAKKALTKEQKRVLLRQVETFMSAEHSIKLSDFLYHLQYFVFKEKEDRWVSKSRRWLHNKLRTWSCLRHHWSPLAATLQHPIRSYYTQEEVDRAMNYLIHRYHDFIDRRRGSITGESYHSGGVLLHKSKPSMADKRGGLEDIITDTASDVKQLGRQLEAESRTLEHKLQGVDTRLKQLYKHDRSLSDGMGAPRSAPGSSRNLRVSHSLLPTPDNKSLDDWYTYDSQHLLCEPSSTTSEERSAAADAVLHEAIVGLSQELTNGHEMEPADWYTVPVPHIAYDEILQKLEEANLAHDPSFNREHSWSHRRDGLPRDKQTKLPTLRQDEFESQLDGNRSSFRTGNAISAGVGEAKSAPQLSVEDPESPAPLELSLPKKRKGRKKKPPALTVRP